jgi:hypothetical protein
MQIDGPMLLELQTDPLGFRVTVPMEAHALRFFIGLTAAAAQSLALALLARPEVGTELLPEVAQAIAAEGRERQQAKQTDEQFLKDLGVQA